ncbi:YqgE/AlgH family protein [Glaciecola sp. KUL10]|jgi:putative transcriptional regulator|uniref:YqgE/AlgH family protein n=1 Tax=Glaciecola sp. (strain KUL10) TaxID=2161813 RepID=UPI000D78C81D|nr:YqgE/AlgH family protein [Glaciecola sp. KUL10]GBL05585.1 transcriptional regulator [Glaciecola sp. KUL10]
MQQLKTLENQLLIAMPSLTDKYFSRSVTYICEHNENGAMGIVINQPSTMTFNELISQTDETAVVDDNKKSTIVLCGGPVHPDRGFILHSSQPGWNSSVELTSEIMVTTSKDILSVIGNDKGPDKSIVALGYAGWEAGQLEQEIQENAWLTVPADLDLLFNTPIHNRWQAAVNRLGIDVWQLTQDAGHA